MNVFVVEDTPAFNKLMTSYLKSNKIGEIYSFLSGEECIAGLDVKPDIVLQDYDMTGINGIETMKKVKERYPETEFIFLSGQTSIKVAVDAIKLGAYDYIIKDEYAPDNAINKIKRIISIIKLKEEKKAFKFYTTITGIFLAATWIFAILRFINVI